MFQVRKHDTKSLRWWYLRKEEIDFSPSYQRRGGVWSTRDKAYLIDSIVNSYDIPKIYLADFTILNTSLNERSKSYAVIDGRQRLEAIVEFFEDQISLDKDFVYDADNRLKLGGLTYSDLRKQYPRVLEKFDEFNLDVMSVISDDELKINELFVRLNKSKPVNGAEVRNAMKGSVPKFIRVIDEHQFFEHKVKFNTNRGQSKNTAAKLLLIEFRDRLVDLKKTNLDKLVAEAVQAESYDFDKAVVRVISILDEMSKVFVDRDPLLASEGIVPVYYWLIRSLGGASDMRAFLVDFEQKRKADQSKNPTDRSQVYLTYELMNRNTNDQGSLLGRFELLEQEYRKFVGRTFWDAYVH